MIVRHAKVGKDDFVYCNCCGDRAMGKSNPKYTMICFCDTLAYDDSQYTLCSGCVKKLIKKAMKLLEGGE